MPRYQVTAFANVGEDSFMGWTPTAPMAEVGVFAMDGDDASDAAEGFFAVGNRMCPDAAGDSYPTDVRSLSVGDMLVVVGRDGRTTILSVQGTGFAFIPEPVNPVVALEGSSATSRPAKEPADGDAA